VLRKIQPACSAIAPLRETPSAAQRFVRASMHCIAHECRRAARQSLKRSGIGMAGEQAGKKGALSCHKAMAAPPASAMSAGSRCRHDERQLHPLRRHAKLQRRRR